MTFFLGFYKNPVHAAVGYVNSDETLKHRIVLAIETITQIMLRCVSHLSIFHITQVAYVKFY
jgi:hypothetical protein